MAEDSKSALPDQAAAWNAHNLSQLRYFSSLSLRTKLEAVQGMADTIRHFNLMRAQGKFRRLRAAPDGKVS